MPRKALPRLCGLCGMSIGVTRNLYCAPCAKLIRKNPKLRNPSSDFTSGWWPSRTGETIDRYAARMGKTGIDLFWEQLETE